MRYLLTAVALVGALFLGVSPVASSAAQPNIVCQGKLFCNSCHLNGIVLICTDAASRANEIAQAAPVSRPAAAAEPAIVCSLRNPCFPPAFPFCGIHGSCTLTVPSFSEMLRSFGAALRI
jgi:hypothetical protein